MKIYIETNSARLEEIEYRIALFPREVDAGDGDLNMHGFFITNRNIIFGQYLYVLHETELSSESYIDFVTVRQFNKQILLNSTRKNEYELQAKLNLIEDTRIKAEMERIVEDWLETGFSVAPLTISTPENFTFEWNKGQSSRVYFYIMKKKQQNLSGTIQKNSVVFYFELGELESFRRTIDWIENQRNYYRLQADNRGKSRDYHLYCIDISGYESDEIDAVFQREKEVATMRRKLHAVSQPPKR